jgi:hypothetical protein
VKKIPKRFKLMGHTINVVLVPLKQWKWDEDFAHWDIERLEIQVCKGRKSIELHKFYHEVMHAMLEMAGRNDLSENETLVDTLGGLMAQFALTSEST